MHKVRWSYVFLVLWATTFGLGLYLVPGLSLWYLAPLSLINALVVLIFAWGIAGIGSERAGRKVFGVLLILVLIGVAYQNSGALSSLGPRSVARAYQGEASSVPLAFLSGLLSQGSTQSRSSTFTFRSATSTLSSKTDTSGATTTNSTMAPSPNIINGTAVITYPPNYDQLAQYTLGLINNDRSLRGLGNLTLSTVPSGQQHADSMNYFGYYSHWDIQGYKPYMRYTLLGGTGAVSENIGLSYCTNSPPSANSLLLTGCTVQTIENAIANSEWGMMNNDATCCNNGHRDNILNPLHTSVSIGIAYDSSSDTVYFVEDFVDNYITSESLQLSGTTVTFRGVTSQDVAGLVNNNFASEIVVYYDPTPSGIALGELAYNQACNQYNEFNEPTSCQYQGAYDPGTQAGAVFAPCPAGYTCQPGYNYANVWQQTSDGSLIIQFSLSSFETQYGNGVYTLYLYPANSNDSITSLSIFMSGSQ